MRETGPGGEVAVYESAEGEVRVDVRLEQETVWLTQRQMARVFDTTPENVVMHLRNIFASEELAADATTKEFLVVLAVAPGAAAHCTAELAEVARVIEVECERIRFDGIDAPGRHRKCHGADGACYRCGREATEALRAVIGDTSVRCETSGRERCRRWIGACYTADGTDIQTWLVRNGYALAYRKYSERYLPEEGAV